MAETIQVNYEQLADVAKRFEQQFEECEQMVRRVMSSADELSNGGWEGDAATAFQTELNQDVHPGLKRLINGLEEGSQTANRVAQIMREAEEQTKGQTGTTQGTSAAQTETGETAGQDGQVTGDEKGSDQRDPNIEGKSLAEQTIKTAQKFNKNEEHSIDFVRRLEKTFGLPYSEEGQNGQYSKELIAKIAGYQEARGLDVDGKVGEDTLAAIKKDYPETFDAPLKGPAEGQIGREILPPNATEAEKYDFYKKVVKSNYGVFREDEGEVNIVSIRGMKNGKQNANKVGESNDTIAVVWTEGGKMHVKEFHGSVDPGIIEPGKKQINPRGVAHVKDGSYQYYLGRHIQKEKRFNKIKNIFNKIPDNERSIEFTVEDGKRGYTALRQKTPITVYRDTDKYDKDLGRNEQKQHGYIEKDEMVEDRGIHNINMHYSGKGDPWSQGCQVVAGRKEYNDFIGTVKNGSNTDEIPYTVVDASKL